MLPETIPWPCGRRGAQAAALLASRRPARTWFRPPVLHDVYSLPPVSESEGRAVLLINMVKGDSWGGSSIKRLRCRTGQNPEPGAPANQMTRSIRDWTGDSHLQARHRSRPKNKIKLKIEKRKKGQHSFTLWKSKTFQGLSFSLSPFRRHF